MERNSSRGGPHCVNRQQETNGAEEGALCYSLAGTKRLEWLVIRIRPARPDEAAALTGLVLRSKAHWGYGEEFLALCREELALRPEELETLRAHVAERDGGPLLGVFTIRGAPPEGTLEHLYVEPSAMGLGVGGTLLRAARDVARSSGFSALLIHSDPNAEAFYLREGAVRAGSVPSGSIPGRVLPLLRLEL